MCPSGDSVVVHQTLEILCSSGNGNDGKDNDNPPSGEQSAAAASTNENSVPPFSGFDEYVLRTTKVVETYKNILERLHGHSKIFLYDDYKSNLDAINRNFKKYPGLQLYHLHTNPWDHSCDCPWGIDDFDDPDCGAASSIDRTHIGSLAFAMTRLMYIALVPGLNALLYAALIALILTPNPGDP